MSAPKYCIVLASGIADEPHPRLAGRTPLQAARTPNLDALARDGSAGLVTSCPRRLEPGSDVCAMTLLGYDPTVYYTGRAPLEALAAGITLGPLDQVFRTNLITTYDDRMSDPLGGQLEAGESAVLLALLNRELGGAGVEFVAGRGHRMLMVARDLCSFEMTTVAPHRIPGRPLRAYLPKGPGADRLIAMMYRSRELLEEHEINTTRRDLGENPANMIWLWGQGRLPSLPAFADRHGMAGAMISAIESVRGLARAIGWSLVEVAGATGQPGTNYRGKADAALAALETHDLVVVHLAAADGTSHAGNVQMKLKVIEALDREIVGPLREGLAARGAHRLAVLPDHATSLLSRAHLRAPVPFAVAGSGLPARGPAEFNEHTAARSRWKVKPGTGWIGQVLSRAG